MLNLAKAFLFAGAAAGLLGSPGPGIAALVVTGRERGFAKSLPFFLAMQLGLLVALLICALGLSGFILALPGAAFVLTLAAAAYLFYLGFKIATAPVGPEAASAANHNLSAIGGFLLGAANPKAYVAFIALLGSAAVAGALGSGVDLTSKILISLGVTLIVDGAWLFMGVGIGLIGISPRSERRLNLVFGILLILTAALTLL